LSLSTGQRLGPYEILATLGAGGMGEVYRAHDTCLGREVAIRVLPEAVAGTGRDTSASRRPVAGFSSELMTESLGVSPAGRSLTISTLHQTSGLALAEDVAGVEPPRGPRGR
jgi:serine/threonine protein kinase